MKIRYIVFILLFISMIFGCNNILEDNLPYNEALLVVSFSNSISRTLTPTIDMNPVTYDISGVETGGEAFEIIGLTGTSTNPIHLTAGDWTITVNVKNDIGSIIGNGSSVSTLVAGETQTVNITVETLEGSGELSLSATLPEGLLSTPIIEGILTPADGTTPINFSYSLAADGLSGSYSNSSLATGYYTLALTLKDGGVVKSSAVETVRIVKDQVTSGNFTFTYDPALGEITVDVIINIQNPIIITFSGNQSTLPEGSTMTITTLTSDIVDSCNWYLNGQIISENSLTLTFGSDLSLGEYRVDVVVIKNDILSSDYFCFSVIKQIVNPPQFLPAISTVEKGSLITLYSSTSDVSIRYTQGDGAQAEPTETTGILYDPNSKPIINLSSTIKARAYRSGMIESPVSTMNYTVVPSIIGGIIDTNTTLIDSTEYSLTSNMQIAYGSTLTIEPNVKIIGNGYNIEVWGTINAIGIVNKEILFENVNIVPKGNLGENFQIILQYIKLTNGSLYSPTGNGIYGNLVLRDSVISNIPYMYLWYPKEDCYIERNVFLSSGGISVGVKDSIIVYIRNNVFYNQTTNYAVQSWVNYDTSQTLVENNSFLSINKIALDLKLGYSDTAIIGINNYWNTIDTGLIDSMIMDRNDTLDCADYIIYTPFLSSPHENTPDPSPYL